MAATEDESQEAETNEATDSNSSLEQLWRNRNSPSTQRDGQDSRPAPDLPSQHLGTNSQESIKSTAEELKGGEAKSVPGAVENETDRNESKTARGDRKSASLEPTEEGSGNEQLASEKSDDEFGRSSLGASDAPGPVLQPRTQNGDRTTDDPRPSDSLGDLTAGVIDQSTVGEEATVSSSDPSSGESTNLPEDESPKAIDDESDEPVSSETPFNVAPSDLTIAGGSIAENSVSGAYVGSVSGRDANLGETLTYSLVDDAGGRFAIDSSSGEITVADGSLLDHESADTHDVTVRVTDAAGATYDETFTINIGDVNEGPSATDDTGTTSENATISVDVLSNDSDVDAGDSLSLSSVNVASGSGSVSIVGGEVQYDPGSAYDSLAVGESATVEIDYVVSDNDGLTDTGRLTLTVTGSNDGPTVATSIADQSAIEDSAFSFQVPAGSFADLDASDTLTYTATLADGSALPGWLSFDASTRTFSGTPENGDVGSIDVRVTATDDHGSSVTDDFSLTTSNTNDTPHDLVMKGGSVEENAEAGTLVAKVAGSDVDVGDVLTYSLVDDADGRFVIDGNSGEVTVAKGADLDHEAADGHEITIRVTDSAGATYDETFTINIGDVNEGPSATDDTGTTSENATISVDVLSNDSDVDAGDSLSLSSVSVASGSGSISIVGGEVQYDPGSAYDSLAVGESATVEIDYVVTDNDGLTDTGRLTLTVTGSNDGPTVATSIADQSAVEDSAFSFQVPAGSFADLDASDTLTYTATLADGSALPGWLSFDASTRTFSGTPENGDVGSIDVRVTATDDQGSSVTDDFSLTTSNTNDTPDDLSLDNATVNENVADGTVVGTASGSDVDAGDSLSYSLIDDAGGRFAIDSSSGEITVADGSLLDHESADTHDVTVRVTDAAGATYDETFTINIGDVNEGPSATDDTGTTSENATISVDVLSNDSDVDAGDSLSLSSVNVASGSGSVSIVGGEVQYDPGSAYDSLAVGESATVEIDYVVSDNDGLTDTGRLTLTVTGSNDGPTVATSIADQSAIEDSAFSFQVPAGSFADLDASDTLTYTATLADGSALPGWLSFDASTRTFSGTPENGDVGSIDVRVTATDDQGSSVTDDFSLTTSNTNDTPDDLSLDNATVNENVADGTVVGTASGSDVDAGETLTYSLVDDAGGRFAIDSSSGEITVADGSLLDHESADTHDVTVRVTDAAGATYDETFTINIGDVNEGPSATDDTGTTSENATISVDVLSNDSDVDAGDSLSLSSVNVASGSGSVSIVGGEVQYDPGSAYDSLAVGESATVEIDYVVSDNDGLTDTGRLTLTVTGSNDGPTVATSIADQSAIEDSAFSFQVPAGSFADLDASDTLTYTATLADGSALPGWLSFDASTRTFSGTPENGDVGSIDVRVTATDDQGSSVTDDFSLTTSNTNDTPDDLSLDNATVNENVADGTVVGTASGSDVDAGDSLSYSLIDDAGGRFAIDSSSGEITVADGSLLDHESADTHDVTVRVTDAAGATYDETFTINIGDVNEGPSATDDTGTTSENATISVDVLSNDSDVDAGDSLSLSSVSVASGSGSVSIVGGEVQYDPGSAYDSLAVGESATVEIDYVVSDNDGLTDTGRLTLTVTGSNDGPTVATSIADQSAVEDSAFSFQVPAGSFADLDASDTLTYTATLADGSALPGWLSFDASTRTFSGTPENGDVGSIDVRVTATDDHGSSVTDDFSLTTSNTNNTPDDLSLDNATVNENVADGTVVGTASGSDVDAGDSLSYSLIDDAGGRFAIDSSSGEITVADGSLLDHESADTHDVTVRVTDAAGATYDETFTINIGDVNEGPSATDDTGTTSENATISVDVLSNDSDVDAGDSLSLSSVNVASGSGSVSIVGGEVQYDPGSAYDSLAVGESATVEIDYVVSDNDGLTDTGRLTLTVTGSNDGPTVATSIADQSAVEDSAFSFQVPAGSFADLDASDTLTYTATLADGSALPGWLSFDASTRTFSGTPENGDVGSIDVRVTATDDHGSSVTDDFSLTTSNTNDTPHDLVMKGGSVEENAEAGTLVAKVAGSDVDVGDVLTYSLVDDADGRFVIDGNSGEVTVAKGADLDHEAADGHEITIRVTDSAGATYDETFTINIGDVNEGPSATDDTGTTSENATISVDVLSNDSDVDAGDSLSLSSVNVASGSGSVSIVGGEVQYDPGSAYDSLAVGESATVEIDYVVSDNDGLTDTGRLTLTVTGSNDGPTVATSIADQSAIEDSAFSFQVPAGSFADLDASDTLTYTATLADGSALPGWLSFDASTRTFSGTPENGDVGSIDVRVTATDDHGSSVTDDFSLTTSNTNDTPDDLSLDNATVNENVADGTVVGTASGSDVDAGDSLSYSLIDDAGGRFAIDSSSGEITVADGSLLDHESADTHDVTVRVTDAAGATYDETFTINIGDVNEGPSATDDTGTTSENATISVDVLSNDSDVDAGDSLSLSSVSVASGSGSVSIVGGEVQYDPGSAYDSLAVGESATVEIDYVVSDNDGLTDTGRLTLTVTGSNDGPTVATSIADQSAVEDSAFSFQVPAGSFADLDASDTLTYTATLADGSALPGWLSFDASTRTFSGTPENGDVGSIDVRVTATDDHGSSVTDDFSLTTSNTNNTPDDLSLDNATVNENVADGTVVGTASGSDVDAGDSLSYSLIDDAGGRFAIDSSSGEITVADGSLLDHESADTHDVTVRVTDAAGATYDETFTINIGDVNEGPSATDDTGTTSENATISVDVLSNDSDVDAGDSLSLSSVSVASGSGSVSIVGGEVQYDPGSAYDSLAVGESATVEIDYVVSDNDGLTDTGRLTLTVTGSNDGPTVATSIADQSAVEDSAFSFQVPAGSFADLDASDTLTYTATLADGSALPGWLSFDASTRTFSGTPENGDVGSIDVRVTATDDHGSSVTDDFSLTTSNTNDTPHDLVMKGGSVEENAEAGTLVAKVAGSDVDVGDVLTYSLVDDADGRFVIDGNSGEVTVAKGADLDHEAADGHEITIRVTDSAGATYDETFTINIGDVNEGPSATDDTGTTSENATISVDVLSNDSDVDAGDSLSLSSVSVASGSGSVSIVGGEVQYDPGSAYDSLAVGESATVEIDYVVSDNDGLTDTGRLTLTVTGSNDGPTVATSIADQSAIEDSAFSFQVPAGSFADLDASDTLTYTATLADGSALPGWLSFDASTRTFSGTPENGDVGSIDVRVTATDDHGSSVTDDFSLTTSNTNDTPDDLSLDNATVNENVADGTVVGTASGSDVDAGETLTYSLVDDAGGRFAIDSSSGEITVADGSLLDHESADTHDVTIRVTDAAGATYDETFTINVGDVAGQNIVGTANNDSLTGTAEADTIDGGSGGWDTLDGGGDSDTYYARGDGLADTYSDTGSAGTDTIVLKSGTGSTFELVDQFNASNSGIEVIDGSAVTGETLRAQTSGSQINWDFTGITLTGVDQIEGRNADDTITGSSGDDIIVGGGGSDSIVGGDGSDTAVFSGNWTDYTITESGGTYTIVDNVGSDGTDTVSGIETFRFADGDVAVADVLNDAPDDLELSSTSVDENAANGTVVATATGSDVDANDTLSYSLTDNAAGRFAIDANTGEITVADGSQLDYESSTSHDVTVRVTDSAGASYDETFTINVADVVENSTPSDLRYKSDVGTSTTVVSEDFESGATGWSDNTVTSGGVGLDGNYLGGFYGTGGAQAVYKEFTLSGDQDSITINFDFYEFDTWNGEEFSIWVDDQLISTDVYYTQQYYGSSDSSTYGTSTSDTSSNLGGGSYNDQTHNYSFTVDSSATSIKVGFGSNLDESASDNTESWGIDNFEIIENQGGTKLPVEQPSSGTVATGEIVSVGGYKSVDRWSLSHEGGDLTIDMLADGFNGSNLDSIIYLYRDNGGGSYTLVGSNDDGSAGSDGSTSGYDSYLSASNLSAGDYIIAVGSYGTSSSEAIASGDTVTASTVGEYQMTITGSATLNGIATDPSDSSAWGDPNGNAAIVSTSGGGLNADTTIATLEAVDADSGDTAAFSLTNDASGRYSINSSGELNLDVDHDGASAVTDSITVRTVDGAGATYDETFDVTLGTSGTETIIGGSGSDIVHGLAGNDSIYAGDGDDLIYGGSGNDTLYGGAGNDNLLGEDGADLFVLLQGQGNDTVAGGAGGGWTDVIELQDANGGSSIGTYGSDWTLSLDSGSIEASDTTSTDGWLDLTDDAEGTIVMQDGTEIDFSGVEYIQW